MTTICLDCKHLRATVTPTAIICDCDLKHTLDDDDGHDCPDYEQEDFA